MAKVLPRSTFQKLGLAAASLRSAMSSLSSHLTSMRTETDSHGGGRQSMTRRSDLEESKADDDAATKFHIFQFMAKWEWDPTYSGFQRIDGLDGPDPELQTSFIGVSKKYFAKGVERAAFECNELTEVGDGKSFYRTGSRLVAKEYLFEEHHKKNLAMYSSAAKIQATASEYANKFNTAVRRHPHWSPSWNIHFIKCCIYETQLLCADSGSLLMKDCNWTLTEPELEGKYTKWNNNAGMVCHKPTTQAHSLGAIVEGSEEDDEEEPDDRVSITENDVIQAFSHFTLRVSKKKELVCDLQGVYNATDGFTLTDPTINSAKGKGTKGLTDRGQEGIDKFRESHVCSDLCQWLVRQGCYSKRRSIP